MIIKNEDLIYRITKYNYISENYFEVLISQIKNLVKYINDDWDFFNANEFNIDIFCNVDDVYRILCIYYKPSSVRNLIGLIIRILEINEYEYEDEIDSYKKIFNTLNIYHK